MKSPTAVIVSGGTGALGRALVHRLLHQGSRVAVAFRDEVAWQTLRREAGAGDALVGFEAELSDGGSAARFVDRAVSALGRLDAVALLAGGWAGGSRFEQAGPDEWTRMIGQNLDSAAHVCRAALPHLLEDGGSVVAVGSRAAEQDGATMAAYAVAKCALHSLVRVLALENRARRVRFNAVLPGTIDTPANRLAMPAADRSSWTPPDAIALAIAFLLSPDSAPITGALVPVDGGTPQLP
jgi:NAD(P)-dependent dehydrogenase (short-subunit alcohol dehydrogenase family)